MQKHFEVKTGKNKGFYIVTQNKIVDPESYEILANTWGILQYEDTVYFYVRHNVSHNMLIWTHTRFAGHEFNRARYNELLKQLGCDAKLI